MPYRWKEYPAVARRFCIIFSLSLLSFYLFCACVYIQITKNDEDVDDHSLEINGHWSWECSSKKSCRREFLMISFFIASTLFTIYAMCSTVIFNYSLSLSFFFKTRKLQMKFNSFFQFSRDFIMFQREHKCA